MRFRHTVTLKDILVAALLLAHLAVPAKLLEPFGLNSIGDGLGAQKIRLAHGDPERYNYKHPTPAHQSNAGASSQGFVLARQTLCQRSPIANPKT